MEIYMLKIIVYNRILIKMAAKLGEAKLTNQLEPLTKLAPSFSFSQLFSEKLASLTEPYKNLMMI